MAGENVKAAVSQVKRRVGLETPRASDDDGKVGIVRGCLRAFGEGDMDGFLDALSEDVAWEGPSGKTFPGAGEYEGRDTIKEKFIADVERTYATFGFRPESFLDADDEDSVVVIGRFQGEGVDGGSVDVTGVQIWQFQGNRVSRVVVVTDSEPFPKVLDEGESEEQEKKNAEAKEEAESEAQGDSDSESEKGESDSETQAESSNESESRSDSDSESKSESQSDSDSKSQEKSEDQSESGSDSESESSNESESRSESDSKSEARSGDQPESRSESEAKSGA